MPTRFYMPSTGSPSVSPPFATGWDRTIGADRRPMPTVRGSSSKNMHQLTDGILGLKNRLHYQFVSDPIAAGPIGGTVFAVTRCNEDNGANNAAPQFWAGVYDPTGTTLRGVLVDVDNVSSNSPEFNTSGSNRYGFPRQTNYFGDPTIQAVSTVVAEEGDIVVVEIGTRFNTGSVNRWTQIMSGEFGGDDLAAPSAGNFSQSGGSDFSPWIEFSEDLFTDRTPEPQHYDRALSDDARTLLEWSDDFNRAELGSDYGDISGLTLSGDEMVVESSDDDYGSARILVAATAPAEVAFDIRTLSAGDSEYEISVDGGRVTVRAVDGGNVSVAVDPAETELAEIPWVASTLFHVRARVGTLEGEAVWAKVWEDGDPEPGTPQAEFSLPDTVQNGYISEVSIEPFGVALDNLSIDGYVGDFVARQVGLNRYLVDATEVSESVAGELDTPVDLYGYADDTTELSDHVLPFVTRHIDIEPVVSPRTPQVSFTVDGVEIWQAVLFGKTRLATYANGHVGTGEIWVRDDGLTMSFATGSEVIVRFRGVPVWGGFVARIKRQYPFPAGRGGTEDVRYLVLEVVDYNILTRKRVYFDEDDPTNMAVRTWPHGTPDDAVIGQVVSRYLDLSGDGLSFDIQRVGTPAIPTTSCNPDAPDRFGVGSAGWLWAEVMAAISNETGGVWYIDPEKRFRYVDDATQQSRFGYEGLSDAPGGLMIGYRDLEIVVDGTRLLNEQFTWGIGQGSVSPVLGHENDQDSVDEHGLWQSAEMRFDMYCQESVDRRAETWVYGSPQNRRGGKDDALSVKCTVFVPYFRVGDVIEFESTDFGFSDTMPIRGAEITFPTPFDIQMELQIGHQIDSPWNTHEFWWDFDFGFDAPQFDIPELPPFCLCCDWVPPGEVTFGPAFINVCNASSVYASYFWNFDDGVTTLDTTGTYGWSNMSNSATAIPALSGSNHAWVGLYHTETPRIPCGSPQAGRTLLLSLTGACRTQSELSVRPYKALWYSSLSAVNAFAQTWLFDVIGTKFTAIDIFQQVSIPEGAQAVRIHGWRQGGHDNVALTISVPDPDNACPVGVDGGTYLTTPTAASEIVYVYAPNGQLLVLGVDYEIVSGNLVVPITTWWVGAGIVIGYLEERGVHPCDDFETLPPEDPAPDGPTTGEFPMRGDTLGDGSTEYFVALQFQPGSTEVWVDGLRIRLNEDYTEVPDEAKILILSHIDVTEPVAVVISYQRWLTHRLAP